MLLLLSVAFLLPACRLPSTTPPPPEAPAEPGLPPCEVQADGPLDEVPRAWAPGSTTEHAAWRTDAGWVDGQGPLGEGGDGRAWVVHDEVWVEDGAVVWRHPLGGGAAERLDLARLAGIEAEGVGIAGLHVTGAGGLIGGVWVALTGEEEPPRSWAILLEPDGPSAGWAMRTRYPAKGSAPLRFLDVRGDDGRAVLAFQGADGAGVDVVSRRGKPLRRLRLPSPSPEAGGGGALGLLGQGVIAVLPDGRVWLDRPGHRHTETFAEVRRVEVGTEGLLVLTTAGELHTRVAEGVGLAEGLSLEGPVIEAAVLDDRLAILVRGPSGDLELVRGPLDPPRSGPSWARSVAAPDRCRLPGIGEPLLPPLLGADGSVRLIAPVPSTDPDKPPTTRWIQLAPPPRRG